MTYAQEEPAFYERALELQKKGKLEEARTVYEKGLESDPTNPKGLFGLGTVYYSMREYERAAATFQNLLSLNEGSTRSKLYLALCRLHMGMPEDASNDLRRILIDHPGNATAMLALGVSESMAGYPNTAVTTFNKTLELHPQNAAFREKVRKMIRIANEQAGDQEQVQNLAVMNAFNNAISDAALATRLRRGTQGKDIAANLSPPHRMAVMDAVGFFGGEDEGADRVRPDFLKKSDDR
jgi:tetratricopeptide (TPR) repeat protein